MTDFYRTTQSWAFDLLWFAYLQAEGYGLPTSVLALQAISARDHGRAHLDFGSGAGVTSQVFARAGYETTLADISTSLLDFARFRLSRRGAASRFIDLNDEEIGTGRYDVITALDTLILVPDLADVVAGLHAALRPGGWLITNFDVRPPSPENAWHLYDDDLNLRAVLHRAGSFRPAASGTRPAASASTWCTAARTRRPPPSGSGCSSTGSSSPAVPAAPSATRTGAWPP
jgi:SAM-dependent methyltransferase